MSLMRAQTVDAADTSGKDLSGSIMIANEPTERAGEGVVRMVGEGEAGLEGWDDALPQR